MRRHIYIKDFPLNTLKFDYGYGSYSSEDSANKYKDYLERAYNDLIKDNVRFDNKTGKTRSNYGVESELSNPSDHEPFLNIDEAREHFAAYEVLCRASRYYNIDRM